MSSHSPLNDGPRADPTIPTAVRVLGEHSPLSTWAKIPALCREEQQALFEALKGGIEHDARSIRARLVESNLHVVVEQARLFRGRGVALADLAQEGSVALIRAVDQFEPPRHAEFARYAVWLIRRRLRQVTRATLGAYELFEPDAPSVFELSTDSLELDPYATTFRAEVERRAHSLLGMLGDEEERVLKLRFGIGLPDPQSFEEIGRSLGMDPKRVSRLESRALSLLKRRARRFRAEVAE
jgi:RNA polymerase sigma factor (sigma-70 family)